MFCFQYIRYHIICQGNNCVEKYWIEWFSNWKTLKPKSVTFAYWFSVHICDFWNSSFFEKKYEQPKKKIDFSSTLGI